MPRAPRAALGLTEWLCVAATPAFANMALLTGRGESPMDRLCVRARSAAERNGLHILAQERVPFAALAEPEQAPMF
jgi:hypothetical protein